MYKKITFLTTGTLLICLSSNTLINKFEKKENNAKYSTVQNSYYDFMIKMPKTQYLIDAEKKFSIFNENNRFNLSSLDKENTFGDAIEKVKQYFANDNNFYNIEWELAGGNNRPLIHEVTWDTVYLKHAGYKSKKLYIHYKNIGIRHQSQLRRATAKLELYHQYNKFDLSDLGKNNTFADAIQEIKTHFQYDSDFEGIEWEFASTIDRPLLHGETWDTLYLKHHGVKSPAIYLHYKNIGKTKYDYLKKATKKLQVYNQSNKFDLLNSDLDKNNSYGDAIEEVKKHFQYDSDFDKIEWELAGGNKRQLLHGETWDTLYLKYGEYKSEAIYIHYKNISKTKQEILNNAKQKLLAFNQNNRFDLKSATDVQTFGDAIEKVKQHFANDKDFDKIEWVLAGGKNRQLLQKETWDTIYLNYRGKSSEKIYIYYKNAYAYDEKVFKDMVAKIENLYKSGHQFDLAYLKKSDNFGDAIKVAQKDLAMMNKNFINVTFELQGGNNRQLYYEKTWDTIYLNYRGVRSHKLFVSYKNIGLDYSSKFREALSKFFKISTREKFDLSGLNSNQNTYGDALEKVKECFKNDSHFKNMEWRLENDKNRKLNSDEPWDIVYLKYDGLPERKMVIYYKNIPKN